MEEKNKFNEAEIVLGSLFLLALDGFSALLDLTGIGVLIAPIIQGAGSFATTLWFRSKGDEAAMSLGRQLAKYTANFLPVLPTLFLAFLIEANIHNHPKLTTVTKLTQSTSTKALNK